MSNIEPANQADAARRADHERFDELYAAWLVKRARALAPDIGDEEANANCAERERIARELGAIPVGVGDRLLVKLEVLEAALMQHDEAGRLGEFGMIGGIRADLAQAA